MGKVNGGDYLPGQGRRWAESALVRMLAETRRYIGTVLLTVVGFVFGAVMWCAQKAGGVGSYGTS